MPGLDPGIHHLRKKFSKKMDHRVKPGDDDLNWYVGPCEDRLVELGARGAAE